MFYSVLYPTKEQHDQLRHTEAPLVFRDLNFDLMFESIISSNQGYDLAGLYYTPLHDPETIRYRQAVMRDFEDEDIRLAFTGFSTAVHSVGSLMNEILFSRRPTVPIRKRLFPSRRPSDHWSGNYAKKGQMLDCADRYCQAVIHLHDSLIGLSPDSTGLREFTRYLSDYCASIGFTELCSYIKALREELSKVEYCMLIKDGSIRVREYGGQADYSREIIALFDKFRQGDVRDYRHKLPEAPHAMHVEAAVLRLVANYYKEVFGRLDSFCAEYHQFIDSLIFRVSDEVRFYLSWLDYIAPLKEEGLPFCYPKLCEDAAHLHCIEGFDIVLAGVKGRDTVTNDFTLDAPECVIAITGPNQGGKTTFARSIGQLHYLANLGLCVPGREAAVYLCDDIFTHFSREEDITAQVGKLMDDLLRLREVYDNASKRSIIIINEIFSSTTLSDALHLSNQMMDIFSERSALFIIVTFIDEIASRGPETVSMMSTVKADDLMERTYKIVRKPPDKLAYAIDLAGSRGLTYDQICGRLGSGRLDE